MLSQQALEDFKKIWEAEFGEKIPDDFAVAQAINILSLFNVVYRPIEKGWLKEYDNK